MDALETLVNADGSFAFERVLPGNYTVRLIPTTIVPPTNIVVPNKDVANVEIALPPSKEVSGHIVVEAAGQRIPAVSLTLTGASNGMSVGISINPQADGAFKVTLPVGEFRVTAFSAGYAVRSFTYGSTDLMREPLKLAANDASELRIVLSPTLGTVTGTVRGGVVGGVLGGIISTTAPPPPPPTPPPSPLPAGVTRISGAIAQANLISQTPPAYPDLARAARIQGAVVVEAIISKEGTVSEVRVVSGHPLLTQAAVDSAKSGQYKPYMVNGQPAPVVTTITVNFSTQ
jgi:TonB family protein